VRLPHRRHSESCDANACSHRRFMRLFRPPPYVCPARRHRSRACSSFPRILHQDLTPDSHSSARYDHCVTKPKLNHLRSGCRRQGVTARRRRQFRPNGRRSRSSRKVAKRASLRTNHQISNVGLQQQKKHARKRKFYMRGFHTNFENSLRLSECVRINLRINILDRGFQLLTT
jgi:hypothetical protein